MNKIILLLFQLYCQASDFHYQGIPHITMELANQIPHNTSRDFQVKGQPSVYVSGNVSDIVIQQSVVCLYAPVSVNNHIIYYNIYNSMHVNSVE